MKQVQNLYRTIFVDRIEKSEFVELVNLDFGKYKNVSHYGFNAVCKEQQYDWVCYIRNSAVRWSKYTIRSVVGYWCDGGNNCNYGCLQFSYR